MVNRGRIDFSDVESETLLLVEGNDEVRFFNAFLNFLNIRPIQITSVYGKDNFAPFLRNSVIVSRNFLQLKKLILVRDADDDAQAAFQSLGSALTGAGLPVPHDPFLNWATGYPFVSIAILPDGNSRGTLEDLCLRSIQDNDENSAALNCVEQYLICRGLSPGAESGWDSKARLHSYLAVGNRPGLRLGEAADAGVWDWGSPALRPLASFLGQL